jgi:hypothetical protein
LGRFTIIDFEFAVLTDQQVDLRAFDLCDVPEQCNRFKQLDQTFDELGAMLDSVGL